MIFYFSKFLTKQMCSCSLKARGTKTKALEEIIKDYRAKKKKRKETGDFQPEIQPGRALTKFPSQTLIWFGLPHVASV